MKNKRNFTLVELLIVIAIIALLMTILLPSLNKCRELAKAGGCLSNARQLITGALSYTSDYGGWMPVQNDAASHTGYWKLLLSPYLGMSSSLNVISSALSQKAFKCPSFTLLGPGGYGWNSSTGNLAGTNNGFGYQEGNAVRGYVRLDSTTKPSLGAVLGDSTDWTPSYPSDNWAFHYLYSPSCNASYIPSPPVGNRHSKGINIAWADGHGERKTQALLMAGVNGDIDYYYKRVK
jgi:prepilin-type processing-associated H-X9-DG protein/prepilin-type N-terminal cleavage/methylation domain-containing protein